jgi:hypothetical protein
MELQEKYRFSFFADHMQNIYNITSFRTAIPAFRVETKPGQIFSLLVSKDKAQPYILLPTNLCIIDQIKPTGSGQQV